MKQKEVISFFRRQALAWAADDSDAEPIRLQENHCPTWILKLIKEDTFKGSKNHPWKKVIVHEVGIAPKNIIRAVDHIRGECQHFLDMGTNRL